ncbi:MAG: hypothetical protein HY791_27980 [Deltaproteobacteria bacterium]|nr:hypothetical protein [Deltaproteobacteria bacterium]
MPRLWLAGLLVLGSLAARPATATVVKSLTLEEKTKASSLVVFGRVASVEAVWEKPGSSIKTMVTFEVTETLKGKVSAGGKVIVRRSGGRIGAKEHRIEGASTYERGELAVLFLEPVGAEYVEVGVGIGKYEVRTKDGEPYVRFEPSVAELRMSPSGGKISPIQSMTPLKLAEFLDRVRAFSGKKAPSSEPTKYRPLLAAPQHRRVAVRR